MANGFLSLAYMAEISVVLNLAYRELKYPGLHSKIENRIKEIQKKAEKIADLKIDSKYPEYKQLLSLIDADGNMTEWGRAGRKYLESFYNSFVKDRKSLTVVNWSIIYNVLIIIMITSLSSITIEISDQNHYIFGFLLGIMVTVLLLFIPHIPKKWVFLFLPLLIILTICGILFGALYHSSLIEIPLRANINTQQAYGFLWIVIFGILFSLTIIPLFFIKMAALCEEFILGDDNEYLFDDQKAFNLINKYKLSGRIDILAYDMFARHHSITAEAKDREAGVFKAPPN